jgi:predicted lipoprotein
VKKETRYIITLLVVGLLAYNSVYFKPLDEVKASAEEKKFILISFVDDLMDSRMEKVRAISALEFYNRIASDFDELMGSEGKKLGVSNLRYFMIEGEGIVVAIEEENVVLKLDGVPNDSLRIATDFIFGSTLRDASGLVSISDYASTMDFNNISVEINKQVRQKIVAPFIKEVNEGSKVAFVAAAAIDITTPVVKDLRMIPSKLEIVQ